MAAIDSQMLNMIVGFVEEVITKYLPTAIAEYEKSKQMPTVEQILKKHEQMELPDANEVNK